MAEIHRQSTTAERFQEVSVEWVVPQEFSTQDIMFNVAAQAKEARVWPSSTSARDQIVTFDQNHLNDIALLLDQLVVGRTKRETLATHSGLLEPTDNQNYIPREIIEALVTWESFKVFRERALVLLTELYQKGQPLVVKNDLIVSDYSLLRGTLLLMIRPFQEGEQLAELDKEVERLLYSAGRRKQKEKAVSQTTVSTSSSESSEDNPGLWLEPLLEELAKAGDKVRKFFTGK